MELSARPPSPLEKCLSDNPFLPGSPLPTGKGFNPVLTLEVPLASRKGYSDHPAHTSGLYPDPGKGCSDSPQPLESPHLSRDPFSGLSCSPGISSITATPASLPPPVPSPPPPSPSPPPQPPLRPGRCSFEPCYPLLGRPYCREPIISGSPPSSPCFDRRSLLGSPSVRPRSPYCSWISPPRTPRPCPRSPYTDQQTYLCYCGYPSALVTSPVTSPPLPHRPSGTSPVTSPTLPHAPLETGPVTPPSVTHQHPGTDPMISPSTGPGSQGTCPIMSPSLTHRPLRTTPIMSPPLAHRPPETRLLASPLLSHKVLETGISPLLSPWSSGRSYNDPPLSPASSPPTGSFYHVHLKPPDSCEPKPQLDLPLRKNFCGSPLSSQAGTSGSPSSPQESSYHCSHFSPEAHVPAPGSPYCAIRLSPKSTGSLCSPPSQAPIKPCLESILTWEISGNSYLLVEPGTPISSAPCAPCPPCPPCPHPPCPPCPQEPPLPLSSCCPYTVFSFPSPLGNQFISPSQSPPRGSCNEPPLPTPVCPQVKSPKSSELKQPCALHRCRSLVIPLQHTPFDQPRAPKASASPPPPSRPSGPSCMVTSITTYSNPCPKEIPQGTTLPTVIPRTLKPVIPTCLPLRLPFGTVSTNSYAQSSPHGFSIGPPCSTRIYSVVSSTPDPCPLLASLNQSICPSQCHKLPMVPPCGIYSTSRGPAQPYRQPVAPPCSTHIYSFIPLRTPFDPQSLPIGPQTRCHPDTMPCGFHVYSVAPRVSCKECPQVPFGCPLPSSKTSSCSTNVSRSLTVISECQSSDSQSKSSRQSRSQSQNENSHHPCRSRSQSKSLHLHRSQSRNKSPSRKRSRSRSNSSHQSINQDKSECHSRNQGQSESSPCSKSQGQIKSDLHGKSRSRSKSSCHGKRQGKSKSPSHSRSRSKSPCPSKSRGQSESPHHSRSHGGSKSPRHSKK